MINVLVIIVAIVILALQIYYQKKGNKAVKKVVNTLLIILGVFVFIRCAFIITKLFF